MPGRTTTLADADFTQRQVKVIMDYQEVIKVDIELLY